MARTTGCAGDGVHSRASVGRGPRRRSDLACINSFHGGPGEVCKVACAGFARLQRTVREIALIEKGWNRKREPGRYAEAGLAGLPHPCHLFRPPSVAAWMRLQVLVSSLLPVVVSGMHIPAATAQTCLPYVLAGDGWVVGRHAVRRHARPRPWGACLRSATPDFQWPTQDRGCVGATTSYRHSLTTA